MAKFLQHKEVQKCCCHQENHGASLHVHQADYGSISWSNIFVLFREEEYQLITYSKESVQHSRLPLIIGLKVVEKVKHSATAEMGWRPDWAALFWAYFTNLGDATAQQEPVDEAEKGAITSPVLSWKVLVSSERWERADRWMKGQKYFILWWGNSLPESIQVVQACTRTQVCTHARTHPRTHTHKSKAIQEVALYLLL